MLLIFHLKIMIIDAVDTVSAKIELVLKAQEHNIPIISSMELEIKLILPNLKSQIFIKQKYVL